MGTIHLPTEFTLEEGYAVFAPTDKVSLSEEVKRIVDAITFCRENGITRLLSDTTRSAGYPSPSLTERYWIAEEFAEAARSQVVVSFVLPEYLLDPERFGVTVARNRGMRTEVFTERTEALEWLLQP